MRWRWMKLAAWLMAVVGFGREIAAMPGWAQDQAAQSCAVHPAEQPANVLALPATCGAAAFVVDTNQRRLSNLRIVVGDESLYVRGLRLRYVGGGASDTVEIGVQRLLSPGETTDPLPVRRNGMNLVAVTLHVSPTGVVAQPALVALIGDTPSVPTGRETSGTAVAAVGSQRSPAAGQAEPQVATSLDDRQWILAGSAPVRVDDGRQSIVLGRQKGRLDRLAISARGADLQIQSVLVVPYVGQPFIVPMQAIMSGKLSSLIPIEPPDFVREVVVTYVADAPVGRVGVLEVRGHYDENWLGAVGENRQYAGGWVMIGTVDIVASPHAGVPRGNYRIRGPDVGQFKRLKFIARRGAVELGSALVDGGDGRQETVAVNAVLMPDVESAPLAIGDKPTPIGSVTLNPRIRPHARLDATVEVWAQY